MISMTTTKTYEELVRLKTYEERVEYLRTNSHVGDLKFGHARYLNQSFYRSPEWKRVRNQVLLRDLCCDLGLEDRPITHFPIIHHIVPITIEDIRDGNEMILDLNNLITVSDYTHRLIHYGDLKDRPPVVLERKPNDTIPWR